MNTRVLELLKNPKNIQSEDLLLLQQEINAFPYVQNIRALHLYGIHLYDQDNYQKALSTTAAYTTDKKILYQLINGKIQQQPKPIVVEPETIVEEEKVESSETSQLVEEPIVVEEEAIVEVEKVESLETSQIVEELIVVPAVEEKTVLPSAIHNYEEITQDLVQNTPESKTVYVNGERNRILFEGEENFLNDTNNNTIDLESTIESGTIVMQNNTIEPTSVGADFSINSQEEIVSPEINEISNGEIEVKEESPVKEVVAETIVEEVEPKAESIEIPALEVETKEETPVEEIVAETIVEKVEPKAESVEVPVLEVENKEESPVEEVVAETIVEEVEHKVESVEIPALEVETKEETPVEEIVAETISEKVEPKAESVEVPVLEVETKEETPIVAGSAETIVEEDKIHQQEATAEVDNDAELSFHGTDSFMPNVKIDTPSLDNISEVQHVSSTINKHEDEMRRLIEEVEKKMKAKKEVEEKPLETQLEEISTDLNFSETQSFEVKTVKEITPETQAVEEDKIEEEELTSDIVEEKVVSTWKPMSIDAHIPDSILSKSSVSFPIPRVEEIKEVKESIVEEAAPILVEEKEIQIEENKVTAVEIPVVEEQPITETPEIIKPVSKSIEEKKIPTIIKEETIPTSNSAVADDSNVPGFINTWHSWLKIDRNEEVEEDVVEKKNKVIESFIENSPKISQLKDEVSFVVKEKNDDISHLMTETLAKLYTEQKLYAKAIKAYQTLAIKHPDRKAYFEGKVKEVKENRTKN